MSNISTVCLKINIMLLEPRNPNEDLGLNFPMDMTWQRLMLLSLRG